MRSSARFCEHRVRWTYMDSDPDYLPCGKAAVEETSEGYRCEEHRIQSKPLKEPT